MNEQWSCVMSHATARIDIGIKIGTAVIITHEININIVTDGIIEIAEDELADARVGALSASQATVAARARVRGLGGGPDALSS